MSHLIPLPRSSIEYPFLKTRLSKCELAIDFSVGRRTFHLTLNHDCIEANNNDYTLYSGISYVEVTPYWFHSGYVFDEDMNVTYVGGDFSGNQAEECHVQFRVVGKNKHIHV